MSQDQLRGFILKGLYYLLTKYKQLNIVFFSNLFCYYYYYFLNLIVYIRLFFARILSVLPENFQNWGEGGCRPPRPPARTPMPALAKTEFCLSCHARVGRWPLMSLSHFDIVAHCEFAGFSTLDPQCPPACVAYLIYSNI